MSILNFIHTILFLTFFTSVTLFANDEKEFTTKQTPVIIKLLNEAKISWATKDKAKIIAFMQKNAHFYGTASEEMEEHYKAESVELFTKRADGIIRVINELVKIEPSLTRNKFASFRKDQMNIRAIFFEDKWKLIYNTPHQTIAMDLKVSDSIVEKHKPTVIKLLNEAKEAWTTKDKSKITDFMAKRSYIFVENPEEKSAKIEELKEHFMKRSEKALLNQAERVTRVLGELIDVEPLFTAMPNGMYATFQKGKYKVRAMFSEGSWKIKF